MATLVQPPATGFRIKHYIWTLPPFKIINIATSPIFSTFEECQADAHLQFDRFLAFYLHHGQSGIFHNEMNLSKRGLITAYVYTNDTYGRVRQELHPLSEFVIEAVKLQHDHQAPQMRRGVEADASNFPSHHIETSQVGSLALHMRPGPDYELEKCRGWSQTRTPWPPKRDGGPYRRGDDPPYREVLSFS